MAAQIGGRVLGDVADVRQAVGKVGERGGRLVAQIALLQVRVVGFDVGRVGGDNVHAVLRQPENLVGGKPGALCE